MTMTLADRLSTRNAFGLIKIAAERKSAALAEKAAEDKKRVGQTLSLINELSENKFMIFNVDASKKPIDGFTGQLLNNWINLSATELFNSLEVSHGAGFGINLGLQGNKKRILSLDFDVCGDKGADGKRLGCPQTLALLNEYRAGTDRLHGMYSSSTAGNFNVLVDYTLNAEICAMVDAHSGNKFNVAHLEILLRDSTNGNDVQGDWETRITANISQFRTVLRA